jgi:hypothetical protein
MRSTLLVFPLLVLVPACGGQALESGTGQTSPDAGTLPDAHLDSSSDSMQDATTDSAREATADAAPDVVADAKPDSTTIPGQGQKILFEQSRVNYAWGASVTGAYVTAQGQVFTYNYFGTTPGDGAMPYTELVAGMTEEQVTGKFGSNPQLVATVEPNLLLSKFALVGAARAGTLLSQGGCADYGMDRYVGYLYDAATTKYYPVPLGTDGDWSALNTAPEGDLLIEWLRSLIGETGERPCRYRTTVCKGEPCPGLKPCINGSIPMEPNAQGCLANCGSPAQCEQVNACSVCAAANNGCIIDQFGAAHCVAWIPGCQQPPECACAGDSVCAAGSAYCHGSSATGLSCSAP